MDISGRFSSANRAFVARNVFPVRINSFSDSSRGSFYGAFSFIFGEFINIGILVLMYRDE